MLTNWKTEELLKKNYIREPQLAKTCRNFKPIWLPSCSFLFKNKKEYLYWQEDNKLGGTFNNRAMTITLTLAISFLLLLFVSYFR